MLKFFLFLFAIIIFNISNIFAILPIYITGVNTPGNSYNVEIVDDYAYVSDYNAGFAIIRFANDKSNLVSQITTLGAVWNSAKMGDYVYISTTTGVHIYDISNPQYPIFIKNLFGAFTSFDLSLNDDGSLLYVGLTDIIYVVDISDPNSPSYLSSLNLVGEITDIYRFNNFLYLSMWDFGVSIVDVSNPADITLVNSFDFESEAPKAYGIYVNSDNIAFVSTYQDTKIFIYDINDPLNPTLLSILDTPSVVWSVWEYSGILLASASDSGLLIIDVTYPENPVLLETYNNSKYMNSVRIYNGEIYMTDRDGFKILSYAFPEPPNPPPKTGKKNLGLLIASSSFVVFSVAAFISMKIRKNNLKKLKQTTRPLPLNNESDENHRISMVSHISTASSASTMTTESSFWQS